MVKAILFDFWGTLAEQGIWSPVKQVKNILQIEIPFSEYIIRMEQVLMGQSFPSLKEAFEELGREFNLEIEPEKKEELIGLWNKSWMLAQPYPETEEVLKELKEKYRLVLISNTDCFSLPQVLDKFELRGLFEKIFLSYEIGAIKTDKIFLQRVLASLNLRPEDCLLVGDSIQSDIMPARRAGLKAVLVDRKNNRDYHPKIKTLKDLSQFLSQDD